jgi:plasmid stabilization system protein ParE
LRQVQFDSAAETDLQRARRYYEEQRPGLGEEFFAAALSRCQHIARHPLAARVIEGEFRKTPMTGKFHFDIYYYIEAEEIVVVAVMHRRQHPDSWKKQR